MEELAGIGAVDAHTVDLRRVIAEILHVAQDVSLPVLRHEVAEIRPEADVRHRRLVHAPLLRGKAFHQVEALAIDDVLADLAHQLAQRRQREVLLGDARQLLPALHELIRSSAQFGLLLLRQPMHPSLWRVLVIFRLPHRLPGNLFREVVVGSQLPIVRRMLAGSADAVGEDVAWCVVIKPFGGEGVRCFCRAFEENAGRHDFWQSV